MKNNLTPSTISAAGAMRIHTPAWVSELRGSGLLKLTTIIDIVLFVGMSLAAPGLFLSSGNVASMAVQFPAYGVLALAMVAPMITGGIDLSIIALSDLSAIIAALIMQKFVGPTPDASASVIMVVTLAIAASLITGAAGGVINGLIIASIGVSPILATLASSLVFIKSPSWRRAAAPYSACPRHSVG